MMYGIDANPANRAQKTGTEWYAYNLIQAMKRVPLGEGERVILYSAKPLAGALGEMPAGWESHVLGWPLKRFWTQGRLSWEMFRHKPNVLFVPAHVLPRVYPHNKKRSQATVTTIHDVGFKRFPHFWTSNERRYLDVTTRFAVKRAARLLTPSVFTKQEVVELYRAKTESIFVTPLAPDHDRFAQVSAERIDAVRTKYQLSSSVFLTVSRMETKKNIGALVRAFETFKARRGVGDPFQLVLIGKPGFGYATIKQIIDRSPARPFIRELGWVHESDIAPLMASAFAYVYPSWYEGLGISSLEAMAAGTALLASNTPALHEAAGDAAWYFDANAPEDLAKLMTKLVEEGASREQMILAGKERVKNFTWDKTAVLTWDVLRGSVSP